MASIFQPFIMKAKGKLNSKWIVGIVMVVLILVFYFKLDSKTELDTHDDPKLAFESFSKSMKSFWFFLN